ncbi:glycosyltransferase [Periweissella fabalis]|uniref:Glycosyltransferase family 2 protein n=1 Tax=Periweissella fabalis TaxID=1070421 RepID=A0A7X6S3V6_9LACO|nr:glycosyltransferase family 2 protein [Periweissella fabalis]NKZ24332.1 glycosyltransferase family 2 protein [Periweissella fabalis]
MLRLSIIVPVYNEEETVALFYDAVEAVHSELTDIEYEYWFIDDGSSDQTMAEVRKLQAKDDAVHYVTFARNFGKEAALYAGLKNATGDLVTVMDVDLQDPPALLPEMIAGVVSGEWDCIGTRRVSREGESKIRTMFANTFYWLINKISPVEMVPGARDFRVMTRQMVDAILELGEYNRFSKGIFSWVGFKTKYLEYKNIERVAGTTSWSFWGLFRYAIEGIVTFSETPLMIASGLGAAMAGVATISLIFVIIRALINNSSVAGWASTISILLFIGGVQLLVLGIIGRYIGNIYMEVKRRPIYVAREIK